MDWIENNKIPVGRWLADFVDFLNDYLYWFFDAFTISLETLFEWTAWVLVTTPALAIITIISGGAYWLHRSW
jgi:glycine betaine/proline transport system permease protein